MKKTIIMSVLVLLLGAPMAHADVALSTFIGQLLQQDGLTPYDVNSTLAIIADANRSGFNADEFKAPDMWTTDTEDIVLGVFATNDFLGLPGTTQTDLTYSSAGLEIGDPLTLAFYNTPYNPGATGAGGGVWFGTYRTDDPGLGDIGWLNPADGSTVSLTFLTQSVGGNVPDIAGVANMQTAPEPVSAVLGILGGGAMVLRRRLNRAKA